MAEFILDVENTADDHGLHNEDVQLLTVRDSMILEAEYFLIVVTGTSGRGY